jgi:NAD(P)-dependent dehydrogenase (short-subunit alcohol dehydrogenase family)
MAARSAAGVSGGIRNAAVMNATKVLSEELGPKGITVNAVHPALAKTDAQVASIKARAERRGISVEEIEAEMAANLAIRRIVTVEEIGPVVAFLCSPLSGCITGESLSVSGGSSKAVVY